MDDDDWATEVTKLLLTEFDGRAKFEELETMLYQTNLGQGGISHVLRNLSNCNRFSIFKQGKEVKHVSVHWDNVSICCGFIRRGKDTCKRPDCDKFHVCKSFITGYCIRGSRCRFGHDLENEANKKVSDSLGLSSFSAEEIRTIIFRSHPAVCVKYNKKSCSDYSCPDLHVCSHFIIKNCTPGKECFLDHSLQASVHNQWVLNTFDVSHLEEAELRNRILVTFPSKTKINGDPSRYEHLCETYTWTGVCAKGANCPHYHSHKRLPYLWLIGGEGQWSQSYYNIQLEDQFCKLKDFKPKVPTVDFVDFVEFNKSPTVESAAMYPPSSLKRLSTPSYVAAAPRTPLSFYTQWVWYRQERDGTYTPFYPGSLQYTLEDKYLSGQDKYYFEFEKLRLMVDMRSLIQTNLDTKRSTKLIRRPVYIPSGKCRIPEMSPLLLHDIPKHVHQVPDNWSVVDRFQDFELVELDSENSDYCVVQQQFFLTMNVKKHKIVHIFRVQNPGLWDKYCSARRAMIPKDQIQKGVDERQLFHGTPTLQAVRGICANSFDFRRSGENVGAIHGNGAYFSTTARYSHSYTRDHITATGDPQRFMFLGRILVGQYTLGDPSYTKPPERDRLKLYDSCVNDMYNPTIFVIFDLAQSYPEYLIEYTDVSDSRQEAQGQQLKHVSKLQQIPPAIDPSVSLSARSSHHPLLSRKSPDTSSALPPTLGHQSPVSTAASTTSTSVQSSHVPAGGLSTISKGLSEFTSKHLVSQTKPRISTTPQPASRPSAVSLVEEEANKELSLELPTLTRRAVDQQSYLENQPRRSTLTQPVSRSTTVQSEPYSARLPSTSTAGPVSQSALSQRSLRVEAATAEAGQVSSKSTL